jgi:hypothetical protein
MSIYLKTLAYQLFPSKPTFDPSRDIPDLSGKVRRGRSDGFDRLGCAVWLDDEMLNISLMVLCRSLQLREATLVWERRLARYGNRHASFLSRPLPLPYLALLRFYLTQIHHRAFIYVV